MFSAVTTPGTSLTFSVPVKSFNLKPVGGDVFFKFLSTDADADAFPIGDGENINFDVALPFSFTNQEVSVGVVFTASSTVNVYVAATY